MASIAIVTEYTTAAIMVNGQAVQIAQEPPVAEQTVDFTAAATLTTNPLNPNTQLVRIKCNAAASLLFTTNGTQATTANQVLSAGETEFKGVNPGKSTKISFIAAAAGF